MLGAGGLEEGNAAASWDYPTPLTIQNTPRSPTHARARAAQLRLEPGSHSVGVWAEARCTGPTGVEMEALTAAAVAALTVYDMCKAAGKGAVISDLRLEAKAGGRSGAWARGGGGDWARGGGGGGGGGGPTE
jgi:uncharacterized membrane protein YgcG